MSKLPLFDEYAERIAQIKPREAYGRGELQNRKFRLSEKGPLSMYYAPLDYVNTEARIVLIGITPSWEVMQTAFRVASRNLIRGTDPEELLRTVKRFAAFAGDETRDNLTYMLHQLRLGQLFGLTTTYAFWEWEQQHLMHFTSALKYPVFVDGTNYDGKKPVDMMQTEWCIEFIRAHLGPELAQIPNAMFIPLGVKPKEAIQLLIDDRVVDPDRCIMGMLHPSPRNTKRIMADDLDSAPSGALIFKLGHLRRQVCRWVAQFGQDIPGWESWYGRYCQR